MLLEHNTVPTVERLLRRALQEQADGDPDPLRRDMARDVLSGAVTLYQAANSSVYGELFAARADELAQWWEELSEADRDELYAQAEQAIADTGEDDR
jgi:hypothetical protein